MCTNTSISSERHLKSRRTIWRDLPNKGNRFLDLLILPSVA